VEGITDLRLGILTSVFSDVCEKEKRREEKRREEKRREEKRREEKVVRDTTLGREQQIISPVLKAPRQCTLVLLVEEMHTIGIKFYVVGRVAL
jgi:hypothetical protein